MKDSKGQPLNPTDFVNVSVANIICSLLFGKRYEHDDDEFKGLLAAIDALFRGFSDTNILLLPIGRLLSYVFPSMRRSYKALFDSGEVLQAFYRKKIKEANERMDLGEEANDFVMKYVAETRKMEQGTSRISEDWSLPIIHDFFMAGAETTATTLRWALLFMVKYPDVQHKVQQEIESVFGKGPRKFKLSERVELPYTDATIMEIQRRGCIVIGSLVHKVSKEEKIGAYTIPADTPVWALKA